MLGGAEVRNGEERRKKFGQWTGRFNSSRRHEGMRGGGCFSYQIHTCYLPCHVEGACNMCGAIVQASVIGGLEALKGASRVADDRMS